MRLVLAQLEATALRRETIVELTRLAALLAPEQD
jgi:hypothetical protein